jgi:5-methylthioadenosine/S-adenosylhomocysteine deaminase
MKGVADDLNWDELTIKLHNMGLEASLEERILSSIQCFAECVKSGATTAFTASTTVDEPLKATEIIPIRLYAFGMPKDVWEGRGKAKIFKKEIIEKMFYEWSKDSRVGFGIANARAASDYLIKLALDSCKKYKRVFKMHIAQCPEDLSHALRERKGSDVEFLYKLGLNKKQKSVLVQNVFLREKDIELAAKMGCNMIVCPGATSKFGSGLAPLRSFFKAGINVMLGTDSSINNDSNNILAEAMYTSLTYKAAEKDAAFLPAAEVFKMITENARVIEPKIGRIQEGFYADIAVFDPSEYAWNPSYEPIRNLIFNAFNIKPMHVMANGKWLVKDYELKLPKHPLLKEYNIKNEKDLYRKVGKIIEEKKEKMR